MFVSICGVTRVNTDCDTLVEYLNDLNNKIDYDRFLHKAMIVEEVSEDLQISESLCTALQANTAHFGAKIKIAEKNQAIINKVSTF